MLIEWSTMLALAGLPWPPVPVSERAALTALYEATGGEQWVNKAGWGGEASPCDWEGVWCEPLGSEAVVKGLSLSRNGLHGAMPASLLSGLPHLKILWVADNHLSGQVPEGILAAWDRNEFEFQGEGNAFANLVARAAVVSEATGVLCAEDEDVRYAFSIVSSGEAHLESIRCKPDTERETHCLVREGHAYGLTRFGRGLAALSYKNLAPEYSFPFTFTTHDRQLSTTAWFGDGSSWSLSTYGRQGPAEAWAIQSLFLALASDVTWESQRYTSRCEALD